MGRGDREPGTAPAAVADGADETARADDREPVALSSTHTEELRRRIAREVEEVRALYYEGRPFFDEMDRRMREGYAADAVTLARELFGPLPLVTTGRFGDAVAAVTGPERTLRFPGGLRHAEPPPMAIPAGVRYAFVDDSCYKGRTFGRVRRAVEAAGSEVVGGLVLYDGAAVPLDGLRSVYRWRERRAPDDERASPQGRSS